MIVAVATTIALVGGSLVVFAQSPTETPTPNGKQSWHGGLIGCSA